MTQKEMDLVSEMLSTIQKVKEQTDYINTHERIPQLELDAIVARVEKLYELSVALKYFHAHIDDMLIEKQLGDSVDDKEEDDEGHVDSSAVDEVREVEVAIEKPEEHIIEASSIEEFNDTAEANENEVPSSVPEIVDALAQDLSNIGAETTHEKLVGSEDESVAEKLMLQPISDLKSAIGINDKFQFINELFGGDADRFNTQVELLNSIGSFEAAKEHMSNNNWDAGNVVVQSFMTLIERRYL